MFGCRLISQIIPSDDTSSDADPDDRRSRRKNVDRPGFSLPLMSNNFRRFNARVGVLFVLQYRLIKLFSWRQPTRTLSFLVVYSFVCLEPSLLAVLPLAILIFFLMIPSFLARHPPAPTPSKEEMLQSMEWLDGPPLAPAPKIKPAPDLSKDFFRNMRDLQNSMEDFSRLHDFTVSQVLPPFNFADERLSSTLFVLLTLACAALFLFSHLLPWRLIFLASGWAAVATQHPKIQDVLTPPANKLSSKEAGNAEDSALTLLKSLSSKDTLLSPTPEQAQVEIFEIQHHPAPTVATLASTTASSDGPDAPFLEWQPFCFSPTPWDPLSPARLAGEVAPKGSKLFEDVKPPQGWRWADKKWRLDLMAREWVQERFVRSVDVEGEGERWVVDSGGEWRRRRWVRVVERVGLGDGVMEGKG